LIPVLREELSNGVEKPASDRCAGGVMRTALSLLCIGAVTFQLRFLAALVKEAKSMPSSTVIYLVKFKPSRQRGELIEMSMQTRNVSARTGERMAL
jgi:hypothetical protein